MDLRFRLRAIPLVLLPLLVGARSAPGQGVGAAPAPPPPAAPASKLPRVVLVDAVGTIPEVEAFVDRFRYEGEEKESFALIDARLSGGSFSSFVAEPDGDPARAFRKEWPGPVWLSVNLSGCDPKVVATRIPDQTAQGYRYERVIVDVSVECSVEIRRFEPDKGGKPETMRVSGSVRYAPSSSDAIDEPMQEAAREAARKAAKKLKPKPR